VLASLGYLFNTTIDVPVFRTAIMKPQFYLIVISIADKLNLHTYY